MESFQPNRWLGLASGLALVLLVLIVDGVIIWGMAQQGISLVTFLLSLVLLGSLLVIALLGYWLYGLIVSEFLLDRNAFIIRWGAVTQVVPMETVTGVLPGSKVSRITHFRGARWPGLRVGYGEIEGVGSTLFFTTGSLSRQIIFTTPALAYAFSPSDIEIFLKAVRQRLAMGPSQDVEHVSRQPAFLTWRLWSDRLALGLLLGAGVLLLALFGYISLRYPSLTELLPLHFDAAGLPDRWGTRAQIFTLPFIGLLTLIANSGLGFLLYQRERLASYLLWSGAVGVELLVWGATIGILN